MTIYVYATFNEEKAIVRSRINTPAMDTITDLQIY